MVDKKRREFIGEASGAIIGLSGISIASQKTQAKSPNISKRKTTLVEISLEVIEEGLQNEPYAAVCKSLPDYWIEDTSKGNRAVLSKHSESLENKHTVTVISDEGITNGQKNAEISLSDVVRDGKPGRSHQKLIGYSLADDLEITATPGQAEFSVGTNDLKLSKGKKLREKIHAKIEGPEGGHQEAEMEVTGTHHGKLKILSHPNQLLMPKNKRSKKAMRKLGASDNKKPAESEKSASVVDHQSHDVYGIATIGGGQ